MMMLSAVGGIVGAEGLVKRIIVAEQWRLHLHVQQGERLVIVPGLLVEEPVPWNEIASVIQQVEDYVRASPLP